MQKYNVPGGNFSTVVSSNTEDRKTLFLGIEKAERTGADIVFDTDLDYERVGTVLKTNDVSQIATRTSGKEQTIKIYYSIQDYSKNQGDYSNLQKKYRRTKEVRGTEV